ncbi:MAG: RNA polymerase sigma factor [Myxococcota bacterium]
MSDYASEAGRISVPFMAGRLKMATAPPRAGGDADDGVLVSQAQRGDRVAFGVLYRRHAPLLLSMARRRLSHGDHAVDLVHEVFMEAWRRVRRFDPERGPVRAWLVTILRSRLIDRLRKDLRNRETIRDEVVEGQASDDLVSAWPDAMRIPSMLAELTADQRHALQLTYVQGLTMKEAADVEGVPVGTLKARVHRALARLRAVLGEERRS